jgi:hypothetical protein
MDSETSDLIDNALRCYRLAAACTDRQIMQRLREIGAEYRRQALARGADPTFLPWPETLRDPGCADPPVFETPSEN